MQEVIIKEVYTKVLAHARGVWRHRLHMVVVAWLICLIGWAGVYMLKDQYRSVARIALINPQNELRPYLGSLTVNYNVANETQKVLGRLRMRSNVARIAESINIGFKQTDPIGFSGFVTELLRSISVIRSKGNEYRITSTHSNPRIAQQVVQGLLDILRESTIESETLTRTQAAKTFLTEKIQQYEARVAKADAALQEFRKRNARLMGGEKGTYYERLQETIRVIEEDRVELKEVESRRDELYRQLEGEPSRGKDLMRNSSGGENAKRIEALQAKLTEMKGLYYTKGGKKLMLYPDNHPDVMTIRRAIAKLERQDLGEDEPFSEPDILREPESREKNPVRRQLKMAMSEADVEIASIRGRIEEYNRKLEELKKLENILPAMEAELIRLKHDYDVNKRTLVTLLAQEEKARFSGEIVEHDTQIKFKLISLPNLPVTPSGPRRQLFNAIVFLGGLVSGFTMALFLTIVRPVFDSRESLKGALGLTVLGSVSMTEVINDSWMESNWAFFVGLFSLIAVFVYVWVP